MSLGVDLACSPNACRASASHRAKGDGDGMACRLSALTDPLADLITTAQHLPVLEGWEHCFSFWLD